MNYLCLSTNSVNMPDRQTNEQYISWKCAESRFLSLCVQKKCIINLKLFEPDQVRSLIVFAYLFANHLEALPFLLVINNSKQKKGKKLHFINGKNWWKQDSWFGGLMLRTRYISVIRTFWKMSIWWHFYITTINSPLISERQTRKSLSATS